MQGLDYAYTLQGWLKGINGTAVGDGSNDMGQDGLFDRMTVARDVFGLGLHYYDTIGHSDYRAIGDGVAPFAKPNNTDIRSLYNGNIAGMSVNLAALGRASAGVNAEPLFYKYRYDQLNRLVSMRAYKGFNNATNAWTPVLLDDYREDVRYDANGNILNYIRNGSPEVPDSAKLMDSLTYKYWANTNQLKQVLDDAGYSGNYWADIDNQTETENYVYDAIGNLVQDKAENLTIAWNVYGKIKTITKSGGNTITYTYDAAGNRISKLYNDELTVYVRDASGNVMNVYVGAPATTWSLSETHLYGSSRLGLIDGPGIAPETGITLEGGYEPATLYSFERGRKIFDLSNHLGNVLATVKDRTLAVDDGNGEVTYYEGDVVTANDYYPFGMLMPGRTYGALGRYGFNGKEQDSEIKGMGMQYDYGFRIYDPRVGRFLSVDPLFQSYPWYTPYQFAGNMPIWAIDLDGLEELKTTKKIKIFAITANGRTMKEGETFIDPFGGTPVVRVVGTTVVQEGDPGGPLEIKSIYVNLLTGREEYLEYSTTPKAPVHPQKIPDPEPNTKNNTSQTNEVETDPLQPGSVGTKAPDVISWREGVEHVYTDNFIQLPKTYSIDIRFELKRANFLSDAAAAKSMNDFTSQLQKDGIREINYTLSVAAGSGDASTDYYKNVRELALARATKINSMLAAKGIKGSAQINYVGGDSPTITAEAINPVMQNIRVGYRETVYKIRQKLVNGKPTGAVKRSGQIGASKSSLSPNSSTPQNKTEWNR